MKDLYSILNITKQATDKDIKKSYKSLAFTCHPDRNKSESATTQFQNISQAYQILSDPTKRDTYDKFGYDVASNQSSINPLDLFQSLFNVDFSQHMNSNVFFFSDLSPMGFFSHIPTNTLTYHLDITLPELYSGTQKEFIIQSKQSSGILQDTKYVINVKPGTKHKEHLDVNGGGHYNPSTQSHDDLFILINELPHPLYKRKNNDLYRVHTLSLRDALCGSTFTLDHFENPLSVSIPDIVTPNSIFQIYGQGMPIKQQSQPSLQNESPPDDPLHGNLLLDLKIDFPTYLSDTQKDYLTKILEPDRNESPQSQALVQAFFFKNKEEVVQQYLDHDQSQEDDEGGCLQQ